MPPKRRGRKPKNPVPEEPAGDEVVQIVEVPEKKAKIEEPTPEPEPAPVEEQDTRESEKMVVPEDEDQEEMKDSKEDQENAQSTMPLWAKMTQFFTKKNARHFFQHFSTVPVNDDEKNSQIMVTGCINAAVWSQTVDQSKVKFAKETIAVTILEHFGIDREQFENNQVHCELFNIGTTPTGLLQKFLGDSHAFRITEEDGGETEDGKKLQSKYKCELMVNGEVKISEMAGQNRHQVHCVQAQMAMKYLEENVDDFIDTISAQQNASSQEAEAQAQQQNEPAAGQQQQQQPFYGNAGAPQMVPPGCDVPPGWKVVGWQPMNNWGSNQAGQEQNQNQNNWQNVIDNAKQNAGQDHQNIGAVDNNFHAPHGQSIQNGKKYSMKILEQLFGNIDCYGSQPVQIVNAVTQKLKIKLEYGPVMPDPAKHQIMSIVLNLTHEDQQPTTFSIIGHGKGGKGAKAAAAVAAMIYIEQCEKKHQYWAEGAGEFITKVVLKLDKKNSAASFELANQGNIMGESQGENDGSAKYIENTLTMVHQYVAYQKPEHAQQCHYSEEVGTNQENLPKFTCQLSALGLTAVGVSLQSKKLAKIECASNWLDEYAKSKSVTAMQLIGTMVKEREEKKKQKSQEQLAQFKKKKELAMKEKNEAKVDASGDQVEVDANAVQEAFS